MSNLKREAVIARPSQMAAAISTVRLRKALRLLRFAPKKQTLLFAAGWQPLNELAP